MIPQNYYSSTAHVRNRRRDVKGNILTYTIPGLKKSIDIPFPDRKLPVCKRCKKIYKTRELCRIRDGHTDVPWNTTYICLTLDESCFTRDSASGDMRLVDEDSHQFIARSITGPPMPYRAKPSTIGGTKAPICMACKDKNYTRHHCREKQQHSQLPWNTVYVMLSAVPSYGGNSVFPTENEVRQVGSSGSKRSSSGSVTSDDRAPKKMRSEDSSEDATTISSDANTGTNTEDQDDIHEVQTSRAILLVIGKDDCKVSWLEIDPLVPRPPPTEYEHNSWENSENVEPMYPGGNMMMNGNMNGSYPPQAWQGFPPGPQGRFHPMMAMGNMMKGGYPVCPPTSYNNSGNNSDDNSPTNQRNPRQPSYDSNFVPMGQGMMNYQGFQNMQYPGDERDNNNQVNGKYPSQSHKQFYDGYGQNGINGNMMGMGRNFNDPMMQMQQNGFPNGGPDYYRRNSGGQTYPPNGRPMDNNGLPPRTPQQPQGMMYPSEHVYNGVPPKNAKPHVYL